jgi:hypothetical protein
MALILSAINTFLRNSSASALSDRDYLFRLALFFRASFFISLASYQAIPALNQLFTNLIDCFAKVHGQHPLPRFQRHVSLPPNCVQRKGAHGQAGFASFTRATWE